MKILTICTAILLASFLSFVSCKSDDDPSVSELDRVTNLLVGNATIGKQWDIAKVTVDEIDYTNEFTGLTLKFMEGSVTATNGKAVFDASDSWAFTNEKATIFTTGSTGLRITIQEITNTKLVLSFTLSESIYGKMEAVAGENIFTFTR